MTSKVPSDSCYLPVHRPTYLLWCLLIFLPANAPLPCLPINTPACQSIKPINQSDESHFSLFFSRSCTVILPAGRKATVPGRQPAEEDPPASRGRPRPTILPREGLRPGGARLPSKRDLPASAPHLRPLSAAFQNGRLAPAHSRPAQGAGRYRDFQS